MLHNHRHRPSVFSSPVRDVVVLLTYPQSPRPVLPGTLFNSPILIICLWNTEAASAPSTSASAEGFEEVFHGPRATGGNQWDVANFTHFFSVVRGRNRYARVLIHHVQDDFSGTAFLDFLYPVERFH